MSNLFSKEYTNYWKSALVKSIDGASIPSNSIAEYFVQYANIKQGEVILDLGCSYGRMGGTLNKFTENIYGVDVDQYAVEQARQGPYRVVQQGSAEITGFPNAFFDFVFCWAVFDVVDHVQGLLEMGRILKKGGRVLITGKNDSYYVDDKLAFIAEKNAYLKQFPNRFTCINNLVKYSKLNGFLIQNLFVFRRRGDFGELKYESVVSENPITEIFYEYLVILEKISETDSQNKILFTNLLDDRFSKTARYHALQVGYDSPAKLFESIGLD